MTERESPAEARAWTLVNEHALALQRLNDAPHGHAWRAATAQVKRAEEALVAAILANAETAWEFERATIVRALREVEGRQPLPSGMSLAADVRTLALTIADLRESIRRMALDGYVEKPPVAPADAVVVAAGPEKIVVAAALRFVEAWVIDGACLLPEHIEADAFALVAACKHAGLIALKDTANG